MKLCLAKTGMFLAAMILPQGIHAQSASDIESIKKIIALQQAEIEAIRKNTVPVGTVVAWPSATPPNGWLICNGMDVSSTDYPELFQAIGTTYNTQVNPTTSDSAAWANPGSGRFRIPDYRGTFLRSAGTSGLSVKTEVGGWQDDATAKNNLTASAGNMSEKASHSHTDSGHTHTSAYFGSSGGIFWGGGNVIANNTPGAAIVSGAASANIQSTNTDHNHAITISSSDTESRPQNKGVNYIIKATSRIP